MKSSSIRSRPRQQVSALLPATRPPPRAVRVVVVERGFVLAIGSSTAEVRAALNGGGAHG